VLSPDNTYKHKYSKVIFDIETTPIDTGVVRAQHPTKSIISLTLVMIKSLAIKHRVSLVDKASEILSNKKKLLTEVYFDLQQYFEEKYGKDALILMEIGTFFEVYEVNNDELKIGKAKEIAELLNIQLTRKTKPFLRTP